MLLETMENRTKDTDSVAVKAASHMACTAWWHEDRTKIKMNEHGTSLDRAINICLVGTF